MSMIEQVFTSLVTIGQTILSTDVVSVVLNIALTLVGGLVEGLSDTVGLFLAQGTCNKNNCPGSFYLPITAAWANIGYMTHGDFVYFVWNTSFGLWAALFYAVGATGALVSVAINQPPRTYMWFFLGPPIYAFLVGTPATVQGVAWRMANKDFNMEEVWRDAETGMANTALVRDLGLQTNRRTGPSGTYQVAWPMVFLDGLFSEATNNLVSWIGMQRREGRGGAQSNLFNRETEEGPWQLLANLKWGMVENIVGVSARDPDVRDTLVTFLTSECGDQFKKGVNSGAYSAAAQSRGANLPKTVFIGADPSTAGVNDKVTVGGNSYANFVRGLDTEAIPTPRSMVRLFNSPAITGSFRQFSNSFSGTQAFDSGRLTDIVCSEYLYMIVQAMRWEAGHSYHQLLRSFPDGFTTAESALKTLFYGWNLRPEEEAALVEGPELVKYTKHLILVHMIRNELMYAPQVTEQGQRFAPSEQARNYTEGFVRQQGSRAKYGELYQWAVMMPHVQGVLAYLVLIGYPFAAMLMVIPGYWKAFFTWVSFFAWVKLWDVGFAIVHTLERSVWAMIGNHSAMARVGRRLIQTAEAAGSDVQVNCTSSGGGGGGTGSVEKLSQLCSVPEVKEAGGFDEDKAWFLFDQAMLLSGSLDLDLSNGYYIYIMAALYFAVPTVTGQLVLGAKASLGGVATQALGQSAQEAGGAAKSGTVGENVNKIATNQASIDQAGRAQSYRKSGLAKQTLDAQNAAMDADIRGAEIGILQRAFGATADARKDTLEGHQANQAFWGATQGALERTAGIGGTTIIQGPTGQGGANNTSRAAPGLKSEMAGDASGAAPQVDAGAGSASSASGGSSPAGLASHSSGSTGRGSAATGTTSPTNGANPSMAGRLVNKAADQGWDSIKGFAKAGGRGALQYPGWGMAGMTNFYSQDLFNARAQSNAAGLDFGMQKASADMAKSGFQAYGQSLGAEADFEASSAAWDAKNAYATHMAGMAGMSGANPGSAAPGPKPSQMRELAGGGVLGQDTRNLSHYGGLGFRSAANRMFDRNRSNGASLYLNSWQPFGFSQSFNAALVTGARQVGDMGSYFTDLTNYFDARNRGDQNALNSSPIHQALQSTAAVSGITQPPSLGSFGDSGGPRNAGGSANVDVLGAVQGFSQAQGDLVPQNATPASSNEPPKP